MENNYAQESLEDIIELVNNSKYAFCHYITPNDIGITGGHQCGYYFPHFAEPMFYNRNQTRGVNDEVNIKICWQKEFYTDSKAKYYGCGTRNENRITCFGRGFEFMQDIYLGCLLVVTRGLDDTFNAYVLPEQANIESFMDTFNLWIGEGNQMITHRLRPESIISNEIANTAELFNIFPDTVAMAQLARDIVNRVNRYNDRIISERSDSVILKWVAAEYELFSSLEEKIYREIYTKPFGSCRDLVEFSNKILNRRKSRAGKSLEHHLATIFKASHVNYEEQVITEGYKKPDFIFPDGISYHNFEFPADRLTMLGAKTTCKDRWRQVLNEADRIDEKHLFTLQKGVSKNQLQEMKDEHLTLVVPKENLTDFHPQYRDGIMCLADFIGMVRERQN